MTFLRKKTKMPKVVRDEEIKNYETFPEIQSTNKNYIKRSNTTFTENIRPWVLKMSFYKKKKFKRKI
jgi:hypothetical protein